MKMTALYKKAERNMQAGVITQEGFLGDDTRPLMDIIADDEAHMQALGMTFEAVAEKLRYLAHEGAKALGEPATIDGTWLVQAEDVRGMLPSPFEDGIFHKNSIHVTHLASGKQLIYSDLSLHLLETYHFLQGKASLFRLDPRELKSVLEL